LQKTLKGMLSKKTLAIYMLSTVVVTATISFFSAKYFFSNKDTDVDNPDVAGNSKKMLKPECRYDITRLKGFKRIGPIVSAAQECEEETLMPLKMNVANYIDNEKNAGRIIDASVYMRRLSDDAWVNINPEITYHPASLLKVPQLITYLKMAETEPGLLDRKYVFNTPIGEMPVQYYSAKTLQPGHKYSIKELFHYMIVYSDNYANLELVSRMNMNVFNKTFRDLQLTPPDLMDQDYTISTRDYSKFLETLYNAAYLSMQASEYATELLVEATFKDGILKKIPRTVPVAHKMGEWGDGNTVELHDCGIVYIEGSPYIITIMTRGKDMNMLSEAVANISKIVYDSMVGPAM
jgi:beta-lactamase class A